MTLETDAIATGAASWAANLARISDMQDENEVLRILLQDARQQLALYRASAVSNGALLREANATVAAMASVMFWEAGTVA